MKIPPGYKISIVQADGIIMDVIDLEGFDLDKPMATGYVIARIKDIIGFDLENESEE
jgi:hypothetical protein